MLPPAGSAVDHVRLSWQSGLCFTFNEATAPRAFIFSFISMSMIGSQSCDLDLHRTTQGDHEPRLPTGAHAISNAVAFCRARREKPASHLRLLEVVPHMVQGSGFRLAISPSGAI